MSATGGNANTLPRVLVSAVETFTVLAGNFKEVYGDLHNLIPDTAKLMKMIPFKPKAKIGNELRQRSSFKSG